MRIALVTNKDLHHKYWAHAMCKNFDVQLILHPQKKNIIENLKSKRLFRRGITNLILKLISIFYNYIFLYSMSSKLKRMESYYFKNYLEKYDEIPNEIKYNVQSINNKNSINLITEKKIDVICFLGGEIAKKDFISSPKLVSLNYHSGLSPFYNGSKTIFHSITDGYPNYAGGTLMIINEKIDGGEILAHFLPSIKKSDTASSLFMKGIMGSVKLYKVILERLTSNKSISGIKQTNVKKYVTNLDWHINNDLELFKFENSNLINKFIRDEKLFFYSKKSSLEKIINHIGIIQ